MHILILSQLPPIHASSVGANNHGSRTRDLNSIVSSAVYDDFNRLTAWNGQGITYDENGNMLSDGSRTYTWDTRDRLKTISGSSTASFKYDALGRRLTKTINGATTSYQYDGDNIVGEFSATNAPTASVSSLGVDGWLSRTEGATNRQFLTDALGSVIATTDSSGALKTQYTYEPYGRTTSTGEASSNPYQYTGRENDGTGLYYYRARYYNPSFQRFISSDPIGLSGGLNTYEYVGGNPLSFRDPSGNWIWAIGCAVGGGFNVISGLTNGATSDQLIRTAGIGCLTGALSVVNFPVAVVAGALNSAGNRLIGLYTTCDAIADIIIGGVSGGVGAALGGAGKDLLKGTVSEGVGKAVEAFGSASGVSFGPPIAGGAIAYATGVSGASPKNCGTPPLPNKLPFAQIPSESPRSYMAMK